MLAAAPAWFADNLVQIAAVTLLLLTIVIVRMIQKMALRVTLIAIVGAIAVFVYANRVELEVCAKTCECTLVGRHVTVPTCQSDLEL